MKFLIVFAAVFACATAASITPDALARVIQLLNELNPDGSWINDLQVDNGIAQRQEGHVVSLPGIENPTIQVKGSYTQLGPNGEPQVLNYVADENGYRATGPQVPVSP